MTRAQRIYFVVCAALIGFSVGYALPIYAHLKRHFYDPMAHSWSWTNNAGPVPMGYYGQQLWALSGALVFAGMTAVATRFLRSVSDRMYLLWAAWSLTALLVIVGYFTWNNWP